MKSKIQILVIVVLMLLNNDLFSRDMIYSTSTLEAGPVGTASTMAASLGGLESFLYNPATYCSYKHAYRPENPRLSIFLNPLAPIGYGKDYLETGELADHSFAGPAFFFLRAIQITVHPFTIGAILGEEEYYPLEGAASNPENYKLDWFQIRNLPDSHRSIGFFHINLAERVKIGASVTGYIRNQNVEAVGATYGVYLAPSHQVQVGVFFVELPAGYEDTRRNIAGLEDQSINAGVNFAPEKNTRLMVDFRNIFRETRITEISDIEDSAQDQEVVEPVDEPATQENEEISSQIEVRLGAEYLVGDHLAIRAGSVPNTQDGDYSFTWGIGLLEQHILARERYKYVVPQYMLNYAMLLHFTDTERLVTHMLTFSWEIG